MSWHDPVKLTYESTMDFTFIREHLRKPTFLQSVRWFPLKTNQEDPLKLVPVGQCPGQTPVLSVREPGISSTKMVEPQIYNRLVQPGILYVGCFEPPSARIFEDRAGCSHDLTVLFPSCATVIDHLYHGLPARRLWTLVRA